MTYRPYRRAVQACVFALMLAVPILNLFEIYALTGTFYAINVGGLGIADPVVILQAVFAAGTVGGPLLTAAIFPIILALLFGRVWCGWMCPYHLISDGTCWVRKKLSSRLSGTTEPEPLRVPRAFTANMTRYGFLVAGIVAAGAVGIPVLNYVSAPGIVSTEAMILVKERTVSIEIGFILLLIVLELTVLSRFWCRLFCPTGAFLAVFRGPFTLRVGTGARPPKSPCCTENHCSRACPMGLAPFREGNNFLCTNCGRCIDACMSKRLHFIGFHGSAK